MLIEADYVRCALHNATRQQHIFVGRLQIDLLARQIEVRVVYSLSRFTVRYMAMTSQLFHQQGYITLRVHLIRKPTASD